MLSLEYMAGFFDGEGCIFGARPHKRDPIPRVKIHIGHTYKPVLLEFSQRFGGKVYTYNRNNKKATKTIHDWHLVRETDVTKFLLQIEPLLLEKRSQAILAIEMLSVRYGVIKGDLHSMSRHLSELKHANTRLSMPTGA